MSEPVQMISHPFSGGSIKGAIKGVEFFQMSSVMNYNKFYDHRRGTFPTRFFFTFKGLQSPSPYHFSYNKHNSWGGKVLFLEISLLLMA